MFRKGQRETVWQRHVAQYYGHDVAEALRWGAPDNMAYHARCKRIAVLRAWTDGVAISEIEDTFTVNPYYNLRAGDIRGFADLARFHLAAAFDISDVLLQGHGPGAEDVESLLAQLEAGIPAVALGLLDLPVTLRRGSYLALHQAGLSRPEEIWTAGEERLSDLVGARIAAAVWATRPNAESGDVSQSAKPGE